MSESLEIRPGYDPCGPGLATFVEALGRVYAGDLEPYVELSERVADLPGSARAYGLPAFVDGLQASDRVDEALALVEESIEAARDVGNLRMANALWTAGVALSHIDPSQALAAWDQGVAVVSEHGVDFVAGYLARDAARVHAANSEVEVALDLFANAIDAFQQVGNVAQLVITVALVPHSRTYATAFWQCLVTKRSFVAPSGARSSIWAAPPPTRATKSGSPERSSPEPARRRAG